MQKNDNFKSVLNETFRHLISILEKNNLQWFAGFGTCIGAVRHNGIIPWDDDIDIIMPREDYNRLKSLLQSGINGFYFLDIDDKKYPLTFGKFCNSNTTILEDEKTPITYGIYIDIFPLDYLDLTYDEVRKLKIKYQMIAHNYERASNYYSLGLLWRIFKEKKLRALLSAIKDILVYKPLRHRFKGELDTINSLTNLDKKGLPVVLCGLYGERDIYDRSWFDQYKYVNFEHYKVRIPENYDSYLSFVYGDYMKEPTKEEQLSKHSRFYESIDKCVSITEARMLGRNSK